MELLEDSELRSEADALRQRAENGEPLDDMLPEAFALCREAARRTIGQRHFDVQLIGGMVLNSGAIAEMKTGEGKTLTATLPVFLNSLAGQNVHVVTVNDYLARRDALWMKPIYDALGVKVGVIQDTDLSTDPGRRHRAYEADVVYGTNSEFGFDYLRDNMAQSLEACLPARPRLRDRRRGRQHPHRRGAHAADHLRPARAGGRDLLQVRPPREDHGRRGDEAEAEVARREQGHLRGRVRLRVRREAQDGRPDRARRPHRGEVPRRRQPLHLRARHPRQPPDPGAQGRVALQDRQGLRRDRRPGDDHRRVHRPHPRGPALVGGPAPGDRGEGGRLDPRREPDAGDDHAAELLPPLREALRDDRHRADRGAGVHEDLRDPGRRDPDQRADDPRRPERPDLQDQGRQVEGARQRDHRAQREGPADARRHRLGRDLGDALGAAQAPGRRARRPEREARARPEGGRDRRPGGPDRRGHDRHQHGGPRRRHQARRRPRADGDARAEEDRDLPGRRGLRGGARRRPPRLRGADARPSRRRCSSSAACSSAAPSATSRAASTTSFAAAPAARATPASRASSSPPRTT